MIGALGYAACTITFCTATTLTSAANAILLQYTAPVWVALLGAWLLREPATRVDWLTIAAALGGMTLFFHGNLSLGEIAGDLLALLSGVCFAAMTIALRRQRDGSAVESIILGNALAFAVGLPWIITAPPLPPTGWAALLALGTVQLGVSYWLYARAIRHVTALEAVLIPVIEPVLNPVWVLIFVGERPSGWGLAGGVIVLGAVTARAVASTWASIALDRPLPRASASTCIDLISAWVGSDSALKAPMAKGCPASRATKNCTAGMASSEASIIWMLSGGVSACMSAV